VLSAARPLGSKAPKRIVFVAETQKKDAARAEPIERLAYMLNTSGLTAEVIADIRSTEWTKLLGAVPGLGLSSPIRLELHEIWIKRHLASMWVQLLKETA